MREQGGGVRVAVDILGPSEKWGSRSGGVGSS